MSYIVFDTETTGLFNFKLPPEHPTQPWIIQIAASLYTDEHEVLEQRLLYVFPPEGVSISPEAANVHGITMEIIEENEGITQLEMLEEFKEMVAKADYIVGFNTPFDMGMINAAGRRIDNENYGDIFELKGNYCVMRALTGVLKIPPFRYGTWKWPKLEEAVPICLQREHHGAHDAMVDVEATAELFEYCTLLEQANQQEPDVKKHFQLR